MYRGGVCVYYKDFFTSKEFRVFINLQERINFELKNGEKLFSFISLYKFPSETQDEFENFLESKERN